MSNVTYECVSFHGVFRFMWIIFMRVICVVVAVTFLLTFSSYIYKFLYDAFCNTNRRLRYISKEMSNVCIFFSECKGEKRKMTKPDLTMT